MLIVQGILRNDENHNQWPSTSLLKQAGEKKRRMERVRISRYFLMLRPVNCVDINALLDHLPKWAEKINCN